MSEVERIASEIERGAEGGAWHGPSIQQQLVGVTAEQAAARPIPGAHTVWEIVNHMTAWAKEVERRLWERGQPLAGDGDWPPVTSTDEAAWADATKGLKGAHALLRQAIRELPPTRLSEPVSANGETEHSFYVMLHGLAQHDAYHTGQIAMLKKAIGSQTTS